MSVEKGQILLAGVEDTGTFGARTTAGLGEVKARTWHTLTTRVPLQAHRKVSAGEMTGVSLIFGRQRIKFFPNSSIEGRRYDKITARKQLSFLGIPLPITLERETFRFCEGETVTLLAAQAAVGAQAALERRLLEVTAPYGAVRSSRAEWKTEGSTLEVTLRAECEESIGELRPILLTGAEESQYLQ
jgi:similar to stage IV sporulation protein